MQKQNRWILVSVSALFTCLSIFGLGALIVKQEKAAVTSNLIVGTDNGGLEMVVASQDVCQKQENDENMLYAGCNGFF